MGAFLNSLYEEGTPTEIAYWIGRCEAEWKEYDKKNGTNTLLKLDFGNVFTSDKDKLIKELSKVA